MFVNPSKIRKYKIIRGRTLSFETAKKQYGNAVFIPTTDSDLVARTIDSKLFRPTQLMALYTPRRIKPIGRSPFTVDQREYYADMRAKSNGRIKRGKTLIQSYNGLNLVSDISTEYRTMVSTLNQRHIPLMRQPAMMQKFFENKLKEMNENTDYESVILVFPMDRAIPAGMTQKYFINSKPIASLKDHLTDPLFIFLQSLEMNTIDMSVYKKVKLVCFYIPESDILLAIDIHDPQLKKEMGAFKQKLRRLNSFLAGEDDLSDELESDTQEELEDKETRVENKKEEIKQVILSKVAKEIKADNLDDFEAATQNEKDLIVAIDQKVEKYLEKPANLKKTLKDMSDEIEQDTEVKTKALKYVETKKAGAIRSQTIAKGLEKEVEVISSLQDLDDDEKTNDAEEYDIDIGKNVDDRIRTSHLGSIDEEYNKKQAMTDLTNCVSAFSSVENSPITIDSLTFDDTSDFQSSKKTMHVRYKTEEGKPLSFQLDVPNIVDKRFFYLNGNKKFIKKQLIRLPIVKTLGNRVEITTNANKMTIERTNGKLSRKNAYILKKLKDTANHPGFEIEYGDNSVVNSKMEYSNDFEFEELAASINKITSGKYYLIFNRDDMRDEISLLDIPENFINDKRTPLGFIKVGENIHGLIYIENEKIFQYKIQDKSLEKLENSLFEFLSKDVLKLDMSTLPSIGKSFIYTTLKFLQTTYPLLAVIASQNGLTDILNRYHVKYYKSSKPSKSVDYIDVKFKDCYLCYENTIRNTLLLNSLYMLHTTEYDYAQFDADIPYTHYFMDQLGPSVGIHTRNTLRINLDVAIDPITRDILHDLKQPTNIIDVLLYANTLLVGNQHRPQNDIRNYRVRSNEIVPAAIYGLLADSYVNYRKHKINGKPANLALPKGALISKLSQMTNINSKSTLNPVLEAEQIAQISAKGESGVNLDAAYTLEMRAYDESMVGFLSGNSTPYSGQAGVTRALAYDPKITSVRGYIPDIDKSKLSATNILSPTELLSAFTAAGADAPRQA